jgi:hypothetical protein
MLDFSRKDFSKAISLSLKKRIEIESKWEQLKLGKIAPYVTEKINISEINTINYITTYYRIGVVLLSIRVRQILSG